VVSGQFQRMADGDLVDLLYGEWSTEANSGRDAETPHRLVWAGRNPNCSETLKQGTGSADQT